MSFISELAALLDSNTRSDFRNLPPTLKIKLRTISSKSFATDHRNPEKVLSTVESVRNGMIFVSTVLMLLPGHIIELSLLDKRKKTRNRLFGRVTWYDGDVDHSGVAVKLLKINKEQQVEVLSYSKIGPWLSCV